MIERDCRVSEDVTGCRSRGEAVRPRRYLPGGAMLGIVLFALLILPGCGDDEPRSESTSGVRPSPQPTESVVSPSGTPAAKGELSERVIYSSFDANGIEQIFSMNVDGSDQRQLTSGAAGSVEPSASHDGMRVVFVRLGTGDARDLYVLDLSTGEEQQIPTPPGEVIEPVYSFDDARIAFTLFTGDHDTIYVMNADSTNARRLTGSDFDEKDPAWAPDGNWIAFSSNREPENHDIYVMLADGSGEPVRLTQTAGFDGEPAWSPDGQAIAFQSFRPTADSQNEFNLWLLNPAEGEGGDGFRQLTTTAGNEFDPEWSPDGSNLAYTGQRGQVFGVYVVSAAGGEPTNLTQETARNVRPSWCICLQPPE